VVTDDKLGYEWRRLRQVSEVYAEVNEMRGRYYGKVNMILERRVRKMAERMREVRKEVVMMNNNQKHLTLRQEQLENVNQSLRSSIATIISKKDRLKLEEIEAIQQETMKEMRKLNEQAIVWLILIFSFLSMNRGRTLPD
jgi:exonuclease VII large subunit